MSWRREPALVDPATHQRKTVSLKVAARYLEVDVRTLVKYLDAGELAFIRRGRLRRLEVVEIAAYETRQRRREA